MKDYRILAINPGSTSTKIAVFQNDTCQLEQVIRHSREELLPYQRPDRDVMAQKEMRRQLVERALKTHGIAMESLDAVVGRAGRLPPMLGGAYRITDQLTRDLPRPLIHPALLGALIAKDLGDAYGIPSFFVDPTVVDELTDITRMTGIPQLKRPVIFHALNHKAVGRRYAAEHNTSYDACNLIIAHMGGGISIAAHKLGRAVDVTNASNGEGPMSPERAGGVPAIPLIDMCFSGQYSKADMHRFFTKEGGLNAYLGHSDFRACVEGWQAGHQPETQVFEAMAYQVSKHICSMAAALEGNIDGVILTGGLAYSQPFVEAIKSRVAFLAPVVVYPGEDEMLSLAQGALRVLRGEEQAMDYVSKGPIEE